MATKYGTAREIESTKKELDQIRSLESDPYRFGSINDKSQFRKRKEGLESRLQSLTPPPVKSDDERKTLESRRTMLESFIQGKYESSGFDKPAMQPKQEMWDNPAGATGRLRKWENVVKNYNLDDKGNIVKAKSGYGAISEWKDINRRLVHPEEQMVDPDATSIEKIRPDSNVGRSFIDLKKMSFAQGANVSQEQWDEAVGNYTPPKKKTKVMPPAEKQCEFFKKDGTRCTGYKVHGKEFCLGHSPKKSRMKTEETPTTE